MMKNDQRSDMYLFIREPKFSSIGYKHKVGARFRLSYKYINVPCLKNDISSSFSQLCESFDEIIRLSNASQSQINEEFIPREKPFIVTDAMEDWDIMTTDQFWFDNITEVSKKNRKI